MSITVMHPLDWKARKNTGHPLYCLAISIAWHKRLRTGIDAVELDDLVAQQNETQLLGEDGQPTNRVDLATAQKRYEGAFVDPRGDETRPMTEAVYDAMIAEAIELVKGLKAKSPKPALVRILPHDSLHHACIVKVPGGLDAAAVLTEIRQRPEGMDPLQFAAAIFSKHMLWPADGSQEKADLMDHLGTAFFGVYPDEFLGLLGWKGSDVKKLA